jgi:hypothetical protein
MGTSIPTRVQRVIFIRGIPKFRKHDEPSNATIQSLASRGLGARPYCFEFGHGAESHLPIFPGE